MNTHKTARLKYLRRLEMVQDITERGLATSEAAARHGVTAVTARKWHARYLGGGAEALLDKSSRPARSPRAIDSRVAAAATQSGPRNTTCPEHLRPARRPRASIHS